MSPTLRFEHSHSVKKPAVILCAILTKMHPAMAGWTQRDHKPRIVRPTVTKTSDMVRLQVRDAIWSDERRRLIASFTMTVAAGDDVVANVTTALNYRHSSSAPRWRYIGSRHRSLSQRVEIVINDDGQLLDRFIHRVQRSHFKDDCLPHSTGAIGRLLVMVASANHRSFKSKAVPQASKQEKVAPVARMALDCSIAANHRHVAKLPLAEIFKRPVGQTPIGVAMFQTLFTGDDDHQGKSGRRDDSALLLPSETRVNVGSPIVDSTALKTPGHAMPPRVHQTRAHYTEMRSTS